jgi:hypothetical protein
MPITIGFVKERNSKARQKFCEQEGYWLFAIGKLALKAISRIVRTMCFSLPLTIIFRSAYKIMSFKTRLD